ncbi:MAG: HEAT repeat domain-containing protein [Caldilineae bacterium]|nr:MAG: HEAT repeat domain-containing protein [Caldilineae bacterium]
MHLVSAVAASLALALLRPAGMRDGYQKGVIWYLVLLLAMPGFGLPGICLFLLPGLFFPKPREETLWRDVPVPELPFRPVQVGSRPSYGEGGLASVIASANDPERRLHAVLAARQMNDKLAIPLLQEALKDPVDDVRLFAYSVLDSKENRINERIAALLSEIEQAEDQDRARMHYALAQEYWELAFLGLASGDVLEHALEQAEYHATRAAELGWAGSDVEFLIGRIQLRKGDLDAAEKTFRDSILKGALESAVLPYLAEIAFEKRHFRAVRAMLYRLNNVCDDHPPIPAVVQAWGVEA